MVTIIPFTADKIDLVIAFEKQLRAEEPNTYYWEPDATYVQKLHDSFCDTRFQTAISLLAMRGGKVVGRIEASLITSRCDACCCSAYLDWICVLKSERHQHIGQIMLRELRSALKKSGVEVLIALIAKNKESQRFYHSVENASIHDEGIWIEV
ncbi:MAG TPA: GNAT family N-acetyltransferase [Candidatus Ventrousia excrementavium]|uniref:GNAT family N-acetyltransferase n=1 Tax=Candidatus Ventrousia excrementavium TaxID=2840961 RepID=A0A9D1IWL7_9CLOT|nr:GNAT family N-acetyltransferase [Candidatus Ventrousia excrementavium]